MNWKINLSPFLPFLPAVFVLMRLRLLVLLCGAWWLSAIPPQPARAAPPANKAPILQAPYVGKEIVIARDTKDGFVIGPKWCGSNAVTYYFGSDAYTPDPTPASHGEYWVDFVKNNRIKLELNEVTGRAGCSPDGKWIIYTDEVGGVKGYWRFRIETGEKQKFADGRIGLGSWQLFSPDNNKFLLYRKPFDFVEMPEPRWKIVWLQQKYQGFGGRTWMADSASVLVHNRDLNGMVDEVGIEHLKDGRFQRLNPDIKISMLRVDKDNRIYGLVDKITSSGNSVPGSRLVRCQRSGDNLKCKDLVEIKRERIGSSRVGKPDYFITPDAKYIFYREDGSDCVWRFAVDLLRKECILKTKIGNVFELSPDGKWLLFDTSLLNDGKNELKVVQLPENY